MRRDLRWLLGLLAFPLRLRHPLQALCLLAALMVILHFWREAKVERGNPQALAMARMELPYFVALAQTASALPPASATPEAESAEGVACPKLPLLLHAIAWRWGGLPGLIAADVLVTVLSYCLWCAIFRLLTGRAGVALLGGAATINGTAGAFMGWLRSGAESLYLAAPPFSKALVLAVVLGAIATSIWQARGRALLAPWLRAAVVFILAVWLVYLKFDGAFWTLRFPRPFVTGLFSLLWLLALLMIWRQPRRRLPQLVAGLMAGLVFQSDVYSFGTLGLTTMVVWLVRQRLCLRSLAAFLLPCALAAAPFVWQQFSVSAEMRLRMGLTALPRSAFWKVAGHFTGSYAHLAFAVVTLLAAVLLSPPARSRRAVWVLAIAALATAASPVLLVGVAGQAVQLWHYRYLVPLAFSLFAWASLSATVGSLLGHAPPVATRGTAWGVAMVCGAGAWFLPVEGNIFGGEVAFPRVEFAELLRELRQPAYASSRVLGTWLPEVRAWWLAFRGPALNPDPFATALPEAELERRVLRLAELQEMSPEELAAFLRLGGKVPTAFWQLGHFKYNVWEWYAVAPWSDYSRFVENDYLLPDPTIARLLSEYPSGAAPLPCDLIVRARPDEHANRAPRGYALTYSNRHYQVLRADAGDGRR